MIRTILWLLTVVILLIFSIPFLIVARIIQGNDKYKPAPDFVYDFIVGKLVVFALKFAGCNMHVRGMEKIPEGAKFFVGNHQGYAEIVMLLTLLRPLPVIVAKQELKKIPVIASWMRLFNVVFIDRKNLRQSLQCINEQQDHLEHGNSAMIFPEGTRSRGKEMLPFKSGAFKAAIKAKVPVVPFAVENTYKVFEEKGHLAKADCIISFLDPIPLTGEEKTADLSELVKSRIQAELDSIRAEKNE